jgi:hypothetical protein
MRALSRKRARAERIRQHAVAALYAAAPFCARCGRGDVPLAGHERLGRAQGGDPTKPDCLLCHVCNTWCEDYPREAAETGWKLSKKWGIA